MWNSPSFVGNGCDPSWFVGGYPNSSIDSTDGRTIVPGQANSAVNSTNMAGSIFPRTSRSAKILESDAKFLDSAQDAVRLNESPPGRRLIFPTPGQNFITSSHNIIPSAISQNGHLENPVNTSLYHSNTMMMPRPISQDFPVYNAANSIVPLARPKSQNIIIKRSRGGDDSIHPDNSTENLYDWATWRMYHRITSARRTRIASIAPISHYSDDMSTPVSLQNESLPPIRGDDSQSAPSLSSIDYSHLGEVFEIEI